jgi:hypothetical protein
VQKTLFRVLMHEADCDSHTLMQALLGLHTAEAELPSLEDGVHPPDTALNIRVPSKNL